MKGKFNYILNIKQEKQVRRLVNCTVNFLSGTVAPAKSNPSTNDIEDFAHAMEHYSKRGVNEVIIQPKYMGSRAQIYIFQDINKCYAISRKGYKINHIDLSEVFKERHNFWFKNKLNSDIKLVIEDGELMPWTALGENLINKKFKRYRNLYHRELSILDLLNFDDQIISTMNSFKSDEKRKKDIRNLSSLHHIKEERKKLEKFDHQLQLYSKSDDIKYMPFNILKIVYTNDVEKITMDDNLSNFFNIGKDPYIVTDTNVWKDDIILQKYLKKYIVDKNLEGIVVKPAVYKYTPNRKLCCAPYIKVRNKEYLRIVYGPDYDNPEKLERLVRKKSIGKKVGLSIKEYEIGRKLLHIPINMLNKENPYYKECIIEAILSIEKNKELDPRL